MSVGYLTRRESVGVHEPVLVGDESVSEFGNTLQSLKGGVEVAGVSKVLKTGGSSARNLSSLSLSHVLQETNLLGRAVDLRCGVSRGSTHHHELLTRLGLERREGGVILQLASLDENLLTFGLNVCERVELVLEGLSSGFRVEIDFVLGALVFDDDRNGSHGESAHTEAVGWRTKDVVE